MKRKYTITICTLFIILTMSFSNVFATRSTITLKTKQIWNVRTSLTRTTRYSYLTARCFAVYPTGGGKDNFTRVQVKATNTGNTNITNVITLNETSSAPTNIPIIEGYLNESSVKFCFRGNNPDYSAYADVDYLAN